MKIVDKSFDLANRYRVLVYDEEAGEGYPLKFQEEVTDEEAIEIAEGIKAKRLEELAKLAESELNKEDGITN